MKAKELIEKMEAINDVIFTNIEEKLKVPKGTLMKFVDVIDELEEFFEDPDFVIFLDSNPKYRDQYIKTVSTMAKVLNNMLKVNDLSSIEKKFLELIVSGTMNIIFNLTGDPIAGYYAFDLMKNEDKRERSNK